MSSAANVSGSRRLPVEILAEREVRALIGACSPRASTGVRNRALIATLYRSGVRISEALALEPRDLDPLAGTLNVRYGKGAQQRSVGMDDDAFALLELWLEQRRKLGLVRRRHVFCTLHGSQLTASYTRHLWPRLALKAGLAADKRVHNHAFRRTHAYELLAEGKRLDVISGQLGHHSLATTHRYLVHIAPHERVQAVRGRRAWLHC